MGFNPNIEKRVRQLSNTLEDQIAESEVYQSPQMLNYLNTTAGTLLGSYTTRPDITIVNDGANGMTACTSGDKVIINYACDLIGTFTTPEKRYQAFLGMFLHEIAHCLYLDFGRSDIAHQLLDNGQFYGDLPDDLDDNDSEVLDRVKAAMQVDYYRHLISCVYHELGNILADPHDEDKMIEDWPGFVSSPILHLRESLRSNTYTLEDMEQMIAEEKLTRLQAMYNLILQYARFGSVIYMDDTVFSKSELIKNLLKLGPHCDAARVTDDMEMRYHHMHYIVIALWPYIEEELEKYNNNQQQQNQSQDAGNQQQGNSNASGSQSSGQNGNGNSQGSSSTPQQGGQQPTPEQINSVLKQLHNAAQNAGATNSAVGRKTSQKAKENAKAAAKGQQPSSNPVSQEKAQKQTEQSENVVQSVLSAIKKEIAHDKAEQMVENEQTQDLKNEIQSQLIELDRNNSSCSPHRGIPLKVTRTSGTYSIDAYNSELSSVRLNSKRTQQSIKDALRDMKEGGIRKHRQAPSGGRTIICANDTGRPDQRFFATKKQPEDLPDMAIAVLIDHSGSMSGERIQAAQKAAIMLYDVATGINAPVMVCGHNASNKVHFFVYTDFEKIGSRDKARLGHMYDNIGGCNRDGMALMIAADLLAKRPEELKLLFVISDGQPAHTNYSGYEAEKDIANIVRHYKHKGVEVIAAAIGPDAERVKEIYKDKCLNISDMKTLPKTLVKIVKKRALECTT